MLKNTKRRRVYDEEDSENESKLSEPSTSKAEKEVTHKKFAFTATVAWPRALHGVDTKIARFHCALLAGKNYQIRL
jgi:hypothetical protein